MKLSRVMLAAACIALLSVTHSDAQKAGSANKVIRGCHTFLQPGVKEGSLDAYLQGRCVGVVVALVDVGENLNVCAPNESTGGQWIRVVVSYIDSRPARLHEDFIGLALEALRDAWPCKR